MDDTNTSNRRRASPKSTASNLRDEAEGGGDPAMWAAFGENFRQVQTVLDRNRTLIQQVNENHQSKIHNNMVKNVALIQEINGNISKVVSLYSDLSTNFFTVVNQRTAAGEAKSNSESEEKH